MVAPDGMYASADLLPDLFSGNSIFNVGDFRSMGYWASLTQDLGEHVSGTIILGSMGALTTGGGEPDQQQSRRVALHDSHRAQEGGDGASNRYGALERNSRRGELSMGRPALGDGGAPV